jgi:uncharacterized protein YcbX
VRPELIKVRDEVEKRKSEAYDEKGQAYMKGLQAIGKAHAKVGEDGIALVTADGMNFIVSDQAAFDSAVSIYEGENAEAKIAFDAQGKALVDWLNEEVTIVRWKSDFALIEARTPVPATQEVFLLTEVLDFDPKESAS